MQPQLGLSLDILLLNIEVCYNGTRIVTYINTLLCCLPCTALFSRGGRFFSRMKTILTLKTGGMPVGEELFIIHLILL